MGPRILATCMVVASLLGCAANDNGDLSFTPIDNQSSNGELADTRPFGNDGDKRVTFSRYIDALYQDNVGRNATRQEIASARAAYDSGRGLTEVVRGIFSKPEFQPAIAQLRNVDQGRGASGRSAVGRGSHRRWWDLYSIFSDYYSPRYSFDSYYPYWYSSRSYIYDYLLYSYLLY